MTPRSGSLWGIVLITLATRAAYAGPPSGYRCGRGKPDPTQGKCVCPKDKIAVRDASDNATCAAKQKSKLTVVVRLGTVTSDPPGIDCGDDCTEAYKPGTRIVLTAEAPAGSTFAGWSGGGCSGNGICTITINAPTTVTARFLAPQQVPLTVEKTGFGAVTSLPGGITCGSDCTELYEVGTSVVLTATPVAGATFAGWKGGGCVGAGACNVMIAAPTRTTAIFTSTDVGAMAPGTSGDCGGECTAASKRGRLPARTIVRGPSGVAYVSLMQSKPEAGGSALGATVALELGLTSHFATSLRGGYFRLS